MSETLSTDRRSFLKTGSLVAAPLAMAAPVAALAGDDSRAKLARLEDERAIEALQRKFLRHLNGAGDCGEFIASSGSVDLGEGLRAIAEDLGHETELALAEDGLSATARCACRVERETAFTGDTTLEQMARFEGHGSHRHEERRTLATAFIKGKDGWRIASATLA
ncbi:MAG TPA: hypothetical protein VI168_00545 [Croceibacterium sp.]